MGWVGMGRRIKYHIGFSGRVDQRKTIPHDGFKFLKKKKKMAAKDEIIITLRVLIIYTNGDYSI